MGQLVHHRRQGRRRIPAATAAAAPYRKLGPLLPKLRHELGELAIAGRFITPRRAANWTKRTSYNLMVAVVVQMREPALKIRARGETGSMEHMRDVPASWPSYN